MLKNCCQNADNSHRRLPYGDPCSQNSTSDQKTNAGAGTPHLLRDLKRLLETQVVPQALRERPLCLR